MKRIAWVVLGWLLILSANAQAVDESLPPEIKVLIGMKIPPIAMGIGGQIPEWEYVQGSMLDISPQPQKEIAYEELQRGNKRIFIITFVDSNNHSRTMLDARVLPASLLAYDFSDGKTIMKKNWLRMYILGWRCERVNSGEKIIGLWRSEQGKEDCAHWSSQVKRAWAINPQNGLLTDIPSEGVSCRRLVDGDNVCD